MFRFIRAYRITFEILTAYFVLFFLKKLVRAERAAPLTSSVHHWASRTIIASILKLKGLYIKIGQTLSIMTNFLPQEFREGLEKLQDAVPPHPYAEVEKRFLNDFGKTPLELFHSFDQTPIASASLGQVHVASLDDGTKLAVKLQYPDIDRIAHQDLKTIKRIFGVIDFVFPRYGFKAVYAECARMVLEELDFISEGKNLEKIRNNFKDQRAYHFPKVFWEYSSAKILTVEFVEGIKVSHIDELKKKKIDPHEIAVSFIHAYCKMIFVDGVFHADPHPGNILIMSDKLGASDRSDSLFRIALVDFGATASLPSAMKEGIIRFAEGLIKKDTRLLSSSIKQMGFVAREDNEEAIERIVEYFYSKIKGIKIDDFRQIKLTQFQHLDDLFELRKMDISLKELMSSFHVPKDWILLERALILAFGVVTHLDPQLNPVDIVLPYVEKFVLGDERNLTDMILLGTKELFLSYINMPHQLQRTLTKLEQGKIVLVDKSREAQTQKIYRGIHQIIYTCLLIFTGSLSHWMNSQGNIMGADRMRYVSYTLAGILIVSFFKNRK